MDCTYNDEASKLEKIRDDLLALPTPDERNASLLSVEYAIELTTNAAKGCKKGD